MTFQKTFKKTEVYISANEDSLAQSSLYLCPEVFGQRETKKTGLSSS